MWWLAVEVQRVATARAVEKRHYQVRIVKFFYDFQNPCEKLMWMDCLNFILHWVLVCLSVSEVWRITTQTPAIWGAQKKIHTFFEFWC